MYSIYNLPNYSSFLLSDIAGYYDNIKDND